MIESKTVGFAVVLLALWGAAPLAASAGDAPKPPPVWPQRAGYRFTVTWPSNNTPARGQVLDQYLTFDEDMVAFFDYLQQDPTGLQSTVDRLTVVVGDWRGVSRTIGSLRHQIMMNAHVLRSRALPELVDAIERGDAGPTHDAVRAATLLARSDAQAAKLLGRFLFHKDAELVSSAIRLSYGYEDGIADTLERKRANLRRMNSSERSVARILAVIDSRMHSCAQWDKIVASSNPLEHETRLFPFEFLADVITPHTKCGRYIHQLALRFPNRVGTVIARKAIQSRGWLLDVSRLEDALFFLPPIARLEGLRSSGMPWERPSSFVYEFAWSGSGSLTMAPVKRLETDIVGIIEAHLTTPQDLGIAGVPAGEARQKLVACAVEAAGEMRLWETRWALRRLLMKSDDLDRALMILHALWRIEDVPAKEQAEWIGADNGNVASAALLAYGAEPESDEVNAAIARARQRGDLKEALQRVDVASAAITKYRAIEPAEQVPALFDDFLGDVPEAGWQNPLWHWLGRELWRASEADPAAVAQYVAREPEMTYRHGVAFDRWTWLRERVTPRCRLHVRPIRESQVRNIEQDVTEGIVRRYIGKYQSLPALLATSAKRAEENGKRPPRRDLNLDADLWPPEMAAQVRGISLDGLSDSEAWEAQITVACQWLWANRRNMQRSKRGAYVLIGDDRYDPERTLQIPNEAVPSLQKP